MVLLAGMAMGGLLGWGGQKELDRWMVRWRRSAPWLDEADVWVANWRVRWPWLFPLMAALMTGVTLSLSNLLDGLPWLGLEWVLLILVFVDLELQLLPDVLTLPCLVGGVLLAWSGLSISLWSSCLGALLGFLLLTGVGWLFQRMTGRSGIGGGDAKLLAALGAWLGVAAIPSVLLWGSLAGLLAGLCLRRVHGRASAYPFGPFLVMGGMIMVWWRILGRTL